MKYDLVALLTVFDEIMPATDEELHYYWLKYNRDDGYQVILVVNELREGVSVLVEGPGKICCGSFSGDECTEIRVLDEERACLEAWCGLSPSRRTRVFLALKADSIMDVEVETSEP